MLLPDKICEVGIFVESVLCSNRPNSAESKTGALLNFIPILCAGKISDDAPQEENFAEIIALSPKGVKSDKLKSSLFACPFAFNQLHKNKSPLVQR